MFTAVYLFKRSRSADSSLDNHHGNVEVVSKGTLLRDVVHEENDDTTTMVII